MLNRLVKDTVHTASRFAMFTVVGVGMLAAGVGFLATAAWHLLVQAFGAEVASLALGILFLGAGIVTLALLRSKAREPDTPAPPPPHDYPDLYQAFMAGMRAGKDVRRAR